MPTATPLDRAHTGTAALFGALGDPVRCAIVEHLGTHREATVNELAALFPISLQAVSRHIKVLQAAGVVAQHRNGRERPVRLHAPGMDRAGDWLEARRRELATRYDRLDDLLAELHEGDHR
jgi:DNA-binding transcriptional ArsR family regulator